MEDFVKNVLNRFGNDRSRLMDILLEVQMEYHHVPQAAIDMIADAVGISGIDVEQTLSFYHFFSKEPVGKYAVYLNDSVVANMMGREDVVRAFEEETGAYFNSVTSDGLIGLWDTADIGMNDQEPAAIINNVVFTKLNPEKVRMLVYGFREGKEVKDLLGELGDGNNSHLLVKSMVKNNLRRKGPVLFSPYTPGSGLQKCLELPVLDVIGEIKNSNLRGRGGAGFPTGLKLEFAMRAPGAEKYVVCNADEGEPGTFKERVILTEIPQMIFEGMAIAGYVTGAKQGIMYLRYEYMYLKEYLEDVLDYLRKEKLLGKDILGRKGFDFDVRIQLGAGAYVCGEESALIESLEGKRGEPRNRPPFPVQKGYKDMPTVVNNVETFCDEVKIMIHGGEWFRAMGTKESSGTKMLSISGDCKYPGVYEMEWGMTVKDILSLTGATNVQAVQVGGPSGKCIDPSKFDHEISFEDLATGGAIIIIGKHRDLLRDVVSNYLDFFIDESCSSCAPCRSLTPILKDTLDKILAGDATMKELDDLYSWCRQMKNLNRCGLGQTAANPILSTIENFRHLYEKHISIDEEFYSTFDMNKAVAESCEHVGRVPAVHK
jgi:[NiFe] hydrogenase diaphorase moiety large subunit